MEKKSIVSFLVLGGWGPGLFWMILERKNIDRVSKCVLLKQLIVCLRLLTRFVDLLLCFLMLMADVSIYGANPLPLSVF